MLDAAIGEDRARNRRGRGPENLALPRRPALNLARLEPPGGSMRGKPKLAGQDDAFLTHLLAPFARLQRR